MRIVLVTTEIMSKTAPSGGLANSVSRLAEALTDHGHDAVVVGPKSFAASPSRRKITFHGYRTALSSGLRLLDLLSHKLFPLLSVMDIITQGWVIENFIEPSFELLDMN